MGIEGAHVEIVDDDSDAGSLLPKRVLVNGHDVGLITDGGVKVDPGDNYTVATVTITLIPRRIDIRPAEPSSAVDGNPEHVGLPSVEQLQEAFLATVGYHVGNEDAEAVAKGIRAILARHADADAPPGKEVPK